MLSSLSKDNGIFRFIILLVLHNILFGSRQIVSLAQSRSEYCDACHPVCGRRYFVRVAGATRCNGGSTNHNLHDGVSPLARVEDTRAPSVEP